mgnify:CR=1 FL=1
MYSSLVSDYTTVLVVWLLTILKNIADECKGSIRGSYPRGIRSIRMSVTKRMGQIRVATDLSRVTYLSPVLFLCNK